MSSSRRRFNGQQEVSKHADGQLDAWENRIRAIAAAKRTRAFMGEYVAAMPGAMGIRKDRMRSRRALASVLRVVSVAEEEVDA